MKLLASIIVIILAFSTSVISDEVSPEIVEYSESDQSTDDGILDNQELNAIELELFSKLLSPNDTTLQQGTKSLLAKYIISQILTNKKHPHPGKPPAPAPPAPAPNVQEVRVPVPVPIPEPIAVPESPPPTTEATTEKPTTRRQAPVAEQAQGELTTARVRVTPSPAHVLGQVDKILGNVATGNVIGIVDESLAIRAPGPVRNLVNGILKLVFCNPLDRLMNRCGGSGSGSGGGNPQPAPVPARAPRPRPQIPQIFGPPAASSPSRRPIFGIL